MKSVMLFAAAVIISLCSPDLKAGSVLYGVDYPASATLYTVDQTTGALTTVGAVGLDNVGDLTSDGISQLWGVQITTNSLISINTSTGAGTLGPAITGTAIPPNGGPAFPIVSIAYDPLTGTMFGNTSVPYGGETADELYSINTTTGAATSIGVIGENSVYALGFGQSGKLYGVDGSCDLLSISTSTGVGTVVGATGLGGPVAGCGSFDIASRSDGTMFLADTTSHSLYTVDLTTGAASLVGGYGSSTNVVGLGFIGGQTPEPGTIVLLTTGLGLLGLGAFRKRKS